MVPIREGARGVVEEKNKNHSVLNGVGDVFAPSDVYGVRHLTDQDTILLRGAVTKTMDPKSENVEGKKMILCKHLHGFIHMLHLMVRLKEKLLYNSWSIL